MRATSQERSTGGVDPFEVGERAQTEALRDRRAVERIGQPAVGGVTVRHTPGREVDPFGPLCDGRDPSSVVLDAGTAPPVRSYTMAREERERLEGIARERGLTLAELLRREV